MAGYNLQTFAAGQVVTASQMNNFWQGKDQNLNAYFPDNPMIVHGLVVQASSPPNIFDISAGTLRFIDQVNANSGTTTQMTIADIPAYNDIQFTVAGTGSSPQYYIVALLTETVSSQYEIQVTGSILTTAMTLAEIAATSNPSLYVPLFTITNNGSSQYIIGSDNNSARSYPCLYIQYLRYPLPTFNFSGGATFAGTLFTGDVYSTAYYDLDKIHRPKFPGPINLLIPDATYGMTFGDITTTYINIGGLQYEVMQIARVDGNYNVLANGRISVTISDVSSIGSNTIPLSQFGRNAFVNTISGVAATVATPSVQTSADINSFGAELIIGAVSSVTGSVSVSFSVFFIAS